MPAAPADHPHARIFKLAILSASALLIVIGRPLARKVLVRWEGKSINERAWRATYTERHLLVPPGPRDGYWAANLPKPIADPVLGWRNAETHQPGLVNIDANNLQHAANDPHPNNRVLIVGASVAFGSYASAEDKTYFAQCADHLRQSHRRTEITVMATGGWRSVNELAAFRAGGVAVHPDVVVFLNGVNDLSQHREIPMAQRVSGYLANMREARDFALTNHMRIVFAPQPFLPDKPKKSILETLIVDESYQPISELIDADHQIREQLAGLAVPGKVSVRDCSDVLSDSPQTMFTDLWHFTDIGHAILGTYLANQLAPMLKPTHVSNI